VAEIELISSLNEGALPTRSRNGRDSPHRAISSRNAPIAALTAEFSGNELAAVEFPTESGFLPSTGPDLGAERRGFTEWTVGNNRATLLGCK
jgi:hypothetical protein